MSRVYSHGATLPAWLSCLRRTRRAKHWTVCHRKSHTRRQRMAVLILRPIPMETASTLFTRTSDDLPVGRSLRSIYTTATLPPQHYSSTSVLRTLNLRIDRSAIRSHWCAVQLRCNSKCTEARHSHPLLRVSASALRPCLAVSSQWSGFQTPTLPHVSGAALPLKPLCERPSSICARQLRAATALGNRRAQTKPPPWRSLPCGSQHTARRIRRHAHLTAQHGTAGIVDCLVCRVE